MTNGDYNEKMADLGEKGKKKKKWRVCQKFIKGLAKYSNGKSLFKVWKKLEQDDKGVMSIIVGFTKMTYFAKPANLARIETMGQQNSHIDNW